MAGELAVEHLVVHLRCGLYRVFNELEILVATLGGNSVACRFYSIRQAGIIGKAAAYIAVAPRQIGYCVPAFAIAFLGAGITHKLRGGG